LKYDLSKSISSGKKKQARRFHATLPFAAHASLSDETRR
jgi:hypothetical protein